MKSLILLTSALLAFSCNQALPTGTEKEDKKTSADQPEGATSINNKKIIAPAASTSEIAEDTSLASESVHSQVDEAVSTVVEEASGSVTQGFGLTDSPVDTGTSGVPGARPAPTAIPDVKPPEIKPKTQFTSERTCEEKDGKAIVNIKRSFSMSHEFIASDVTHSGSIETSEEITRTWGQEGKSIACGPKKMFAVIPKVLDRKGLSLDVKFSRKVSREISKVSGAESKTKSRLHETNGTRSINWLDVNSGEETISVHKSLTSDVTHKHEATNKSGEVVKLEMQIKTSTDKPLDVEVVHNIVKGGISSQTIHSGEIVSTLADKGKSVINFSELKFVKRCKPVSGKISGEIYKAGSEKPDLTFDVIIGEKGAKIKFSNGEEKDFNLAGCALEINGDVADHLKGKEPTESVVK